MSGPPHEPARTPALLALAILVLAIVSACGDRSVTLPSYSFPVDAATALDLRTIAEPRPPGMRVEQISSYDRSGGNADLGVGPDTADLLGLLGIPPLLLDNSYLYSEGDRYVVFDAIGPGVVQRIWMTGLDALFADGLGGDIAFEFDDEPAPRLVLTRAELFAGTRAPFLSPLVGNDRASSGGFYSVLPLPFARRLRISTSVAPNWLQITHVRLPLDAKIESFDASVDTGPAARGLDTVGVDPKGIAAEMETERELILAPGERASLWEHSGPGTVLGFEMISPAVGPAEVDEIPTGLVLEARWDDAAKPQVDVPLDDLFGASLGPAARSIAFGRDGGRYYFYLPMPFHRGASIALRNESSAVFSGWRYRLSAIGTVLGKDPGYFHATAREARLEPDGRDYVLLERAGAGHVVGVVLTAGCGERGRCQLPPIANLDGAHLEGDERTTVDGARWPQLHGTGLEDFFNGGFYFVRGPFTLPTHGNPAQAPETSPRRPGLNLRSVYRLLLGDAIPFRTGIRLATEHGPTNDVPAEMSSVVFYYALPAPTSFETDRIVLGSPESESTHALAVEGRIDRTLRSAPRGDDSDTPFEATGFEAVTTRFRIAIVPDNQGVLLRRLADLAVGPQSALVRVDGEPVGEWYTAEHNPFLRWAELDFEIPATFTSGRDTLEIEVDASRSPGPWTAYGYTVTSHVASPPG